MGIGPEVFEFDVRRGEIVAGGVAGFKDALSLGCVRDDNAVMDDLEMFGGVFEAGGPGIIPDGFLVRPGLDRDGSHRRRCIPQNQG